MLSLALQRGYTRKKLLICGDNEQRVRNVNERNVVILLGTIKKTIGSSIKMHLTAVGNNGTLATE